jgi:hypothetical protein
MYILVNKSLTKSQRIPQSSHAVAEFMHTHGSDKKVKTWVEDHRTMVVLESDFSNMDDILNTVEKDGYKARSFREPDLNDVVTAIAFEPMTRQEGGKYFSRLKLA